MGGGGAADGVGPDDFKRRRSEGDVVIDVRTPQEYASGHVAGAVNIDVHAPDFRDRIAEMDPNRTYYLYCRSGSRSGTAAGIMRQAGFEQAYNIGGIGALSRAGVPVER